MAPVPSIPLPEQLPVAQARIAQLEQALQQALWKIQQLEKVLYGASSDRLAEPEVISREQGLLNMFPAPAEPPATQEVVLPESKEEPAPRKPAERRWGVANPQAPAG